MESRTGSLPSFPPVEQLKNARQKMRSILHRVVYAHSLQNGQQVFPIFFFCVFTYFSVISKIQFVPTNLYSLRFNSSYEKSNI